MILTKVEDLALSQEDKPQTTSPTLSITFRRAIFRCEPCLCEALNFVDVVRRMGTAWTTTPPLSVDTAGPVSFLN